MHGDPSGPRYTTLSLPAYAYLPGRDPHPTADPRGHSYDTAPWFAVQEPGRAERWRECRPYLYGVDLFNAGYWWEAHEAWEPLWRGCLKDNVQRRYLQGLIQAANALLKRRMGKRVAVARLALACRQHFSVVPRSRYMGLYVYGWLNNFEQCIQTEGASFPALRLSD